MNGSRGVIIVLCGALAALLLVARVWRSDSDSLRAVSGSNGDTSGPATGGRDENAAGAPRAGAGTDSAHSRVGSTDGAAERGEQRRRRMAAIDAVQRAPRSGSATAGARGRSGEIEAPDASGRALKLDSDSVPEAGSPGTQSAEGALEHTTPEEIPDIVYDGGADKVFDTAAQVKIDDAGAVSGAAGTIAFWIEPQWQRDGPSEATFVQLGDNGLQIFKQGDMLRLQYVANDGEVFGGSAQIGNWRAGDWRHVAATWMGGALALYVDGVQLFLNGAPAPPDLHSDATLYVGSALPGGAPAAAGQLSYLTVLNRTASGEEIMHMFESGGAPDE